MDEKFIKLVAEMRKAQKDFFKTRDSTYLRKSKALEKKVDEELQKHFTNEPPKEQQYLFLRRGKRKQHASAKNQDGRA